MEFRTYPISALNKSDGCDTNYTILLRKNTLSALIYYIVHLFTTYIHLFCHLIVVIEFSVVR